MLPIADWFRRNLSDPQVVLLTVLLGIGLLVIVYLGDMLAPVLASVVIAYLLEGLVGFLERRGWPRLAAVLLVFLVFLVGVVLLFFGILPLVSRQVSDLVAQFPSMVTKGQQVLMKLPEEYPDLVSPAQVQEVFTALRLGIADLGQRILSMSVASVVGLITAGIYLVLMPLLVFFFLKDKVLIIDWFSQFLPPDRTFPKQVWGDVDRQISNYVRGKFWEIVIIWAACLVTFTAFGLQYAMLLSVLVGLSVIVPYIGAVVVTIPVVAVAWFQWGWSPDFLWLTVAYLVIQVLDGNVLVPLLFSEAVNIHPVAIIVAILVFGGIWGFWGVFFAIPLATLVRAVLSAWPRPAAGAPPAG
ncbi:MAG: AI-2E family transporter [Gammaproteobacteria bacterium]|nr:AI-2E family transporter [Gammaproteobacteria bacterium]